MFGGACCHRVYGLCFSSSARIIEHVSVPTTAWGVDFFFFKGLDFVGMSPKILGNLRKLSTYFHLFVVREKSNHMGIICTLRACLDDRIIWDLVRVGKLIV